MAKEILSEIHIEGQNAPLTHFTSITIHQQFNNHHTFELIVNEQVIESVAGYTIDESQNLVGKHITIMFGEKNTSDNIFKGIITELGMQHGKGFWGKAVIKGYSPTFLLERGKHHESYYKKDLTMVLNKIFGNIPSHGMNLNIKPKNTKPITYTTQYGESDFQFINRLASDYGEWFFYDGESLFFGKPDKQKKLTLYYGSQIEEMSFSMRVIPTSIEHYSYNSTDNKVNKSPAPENAEGANGYTTKALSISNKLFSNPVNQPVTSIRADDKSQLDEHAKKTKGIQASSTVLFTAHGDNPGVKLGCIVEVLIDDKLKSKTHGEYMITSINHHLTGTGEYTHTFESIPSANAYIPVKVDRPLAETQMAVVKNNDDPQKLGRVRVQMIWQEAKGELTDWLRVMTPDAGSSDAVSKNRGFVFIPEVNDQVLIGFRYNDPNRPFVLGSMFHGKITQGGGTTNKTKSLATRSGNKLELNDENGSVYLTDKGGANTMMDGAGNITTNANANSTLNVGDTNTINVGAAKEGKTPPAFLTMDAAGNILLDGKTTIKLKVGEKSSIEITNDTITIKSENLVFEGTKSTITSKAETLIDGGTTTISPKGLTKITGSEVQINRG